MPSIIGHVIDNLRLAYFRGRRKTGEPHWVEGPQSIRVFSR